MYSRHAVHARIDLCIQSRFTGMVRLNFKLSRCQAARLTSEPGLVWVRFLRSISFWI